MITCYPSRTILVKKLFHTLASCKRKTVSSVPVSFQGSIITTRFAIPSCRGYAKKKEEIADHEYVNTKFENIPEKNIRNFSIIAHVDHGKSTLADRLLELTGTLKLQQGHNQVLDRLQVERERGITVKAQTASLLYTYKDEEYLLNLIDTPGHVDFSSEVARSLSVVQGVILLVDANQGVQAQTVANFYLAFTKELVILPVLNKVDLKNADPDGVAGQLKTLFGFKPDEVLRISAKVGTGVEELVHKLIERIPPPTTDRSAALRALIFDSWYDRYRGAIVHVYVRDGEVKAGDVVCSAFSKTDYTVRNVGVVRPFEEPTGKLKGGQVGYVVCNMRSPKEAVVGDTLYLKSRPVQALDSFQPAKPMVFAGVYPMDQSEYGDVRSAIEKLTLNDASVDVINDTSPALGQGWRLGFLGLLHMEVFSQRLEQEHNVQALVVAPSVTYKVIIFGKKNIVKYGTDTLMISNPTKWPNDVVIEKTFEPVVLGTIVAPDTYIGPIITLCMEKRGVQKNVINVDTSRVMMQFLLPLNEIIIDFHDLLKSITSGYASFDYEPHDYVESKLVKMDILLNGNAVDELSTIVHASRIETVGRKLCIKLTDVIPRQQFAIAVQASVNGRVCARETVKAYRKDVLAKLYGGDVTRKKKLLKKQSEGKKRMKSIGNIQIPRSAFIDVLKT